MILSKIKSFINNNTTNKIVLLLLFVLLVSEVYQSQTILKLQDNINKTEKALAALNTKIEQLTYETDNNFLAINSRVDILDSAVQVNEKRNMLVKKIRNAITENTTTKMDIRTLNKIAISIIDNSYTYNLSITKILAQIKQESDFNTKAQSTAGAVGLMQVMSDTAKYISLRMGKGHLSVWDTNDNIEMGCFYMAEQLSEFNNNYTKALYGYNAGPNKVKKVDAGLQKYEAETLGYATAVLQWVEVFKKYGLE